ncbi:ABC_transporter family protein [Hexamita inflata]|uniref:ABC_transporter family protein n=1 Tax=Hexamita inflata TaxID=28002 RepID=A0ABP1GHH2_9EUKA
MNLDNWKDKKIQQLSGGMQRLPELPDEAHQIKRIIWTNVKDIARHSRKTPIVTGSSIEGAKVHRVKADKPGVIITSHDINELDTLCDSTLPVGGVHRGPGNFAGAQAEGRKRLHPHDHREGQAQAPGLQAPRRKK